MAKRFGAAASVWAVVLGASTLVGAGRPQQSSNLTVHEWGTFTSVAGPDGQAVDWTPLSGPSELPCFVRLLNPASPKVVYDDGEVDGGWRTTVRAKVRMETPVLYFYSPTELTVDVSVRFPHGVISEWYPQAWVPQYGPFFLVANATGSINWAGVKVLPGARPVLPVESDGSHYYAARETDAAPVQAGGQFEKFLFYRGLASFPVSLAATVAGDGRVVIDNDGTHGVRTAVLFASDGQHVGYRVIGDLGTRSTIEPPAMTASVDGLRRDLEALLVERGLFPREAAAMVATWRDSWFEPGTRLIYVIPKSAVDVILPLQISPAPTSVARVFVGRLEIFTPAALNDVERAIRSNNLAALSKVGRFLEPMAASLAPRFVSGEDQLKLRAAQRTVARTYAAGQSRLCNTK